MNVLKIVYTLEPAGTEWPAALLWGTRPSGFPHVPEIGREPHTAHRVAPEGATESGTYARTRVSEQLILTGLQLKLGLVLSECLLAFARTARLRGSTEGIDM